MFWGIGNEQRTNDTATNNLLDELAQLTRQEDPGRLVTYAHCCSSDSSGLPAYSDVAGAAGSAGAGGASAVRVCATANENESLTVSCPASSTVLAVDFASYGTPSGACGSFATSACHATTSQSVLDTACLGLDSCTVAADNATFGDPCNGTVTELANLARLLRRCASLPTWIASSSGRPRSRPPEARWPTGKGCP